MTSRPRTTRPLAVLVLLVLLTGTSAAAEIPEPPGTTLHVAPGGAPRGAGTAEDPMGSLGGAFAAVTPGGTVLVHPGTYVEDVILDAPDGTADAPITVRATGDSRPRLEGRLWLTTPDHWHVSGLEVTWRDDLEHDRHLVKVTDGVGWTLRDMDIHGARSFAGVLIVGSGERGDEPAGWTVADSCIHDTIATNDTNQDHLVYVNSGLGSGGGTLENNVLFGADNGAAVKLAGPSSTSGGAANVGLRGNVIADVKQGVLVGWGSHDNRIENNTFGPFAAPHAPVRSYRLDNDTNVALDNTSFGNEAFFFHFDSPDGHVLDGGGNEMRSEQDWDGPITCAALRTRSDAPTATDDGASPDHEAPTGRRGYGVWGY